MFTRERRTYLKERLYILLNRVYEKITNFDNINRFVHIYIISRLAPNHQAILHSFYELVR